MGGKNINDHNIHVYLYIYIVQFSKHINIEKGEFKQVYHKKDTLYIIKKNKNYF